MGVCCEPSDATLQVLTDFKPRTTNTGDLIEEWELTLPFSQCNMTAYAHHLRQAHELSGGDGYITLNAMAKSFQTPAW